jgi:hypothetical protein
MADIATLGIRVDTSGVDRARDSLNNMRGAASGAGASARDFSTASEQMSRQLQGMAQQQDRTNQLLQQTNQHLQNGTISTHSYVDSMAKLATVVAGADLAYRGFSSAIDLAGRGMKEQASLVSQLATGLQDLAKYGTNAFQLMSDQAIALQKNLIAIGNAVGTSGSAFAAFSQTLSRAGATGQQIAGAFPAMQGAITGTTVEDQRRRENLARMGVSTQGSPTDIAAAAVAALRQMSAGPERNALAISTLGPGGADMVNQAMGAIIKVTDLERTYQELREANAKAEIAAAQARQEADQKSTEWYEAHPVASLLLSMVPGLNAGKVTGERFGAMQEGMMGSFNELRGLQPGRGAGTDFLSSLGMLFGGQGPGFGEYGKLGKAEAAPPVTAEQQRQGYGLMAGAGFGDQAALQAITDQAQNLQLNWQKLGLTSEQLDAALANLGIKVQEIVDPIGTMTIGMKKQAELFQIPAGPLREQQQALIQAGTTLYEKAHGAGSAALAPTQDIIGAMAPEQQATVRGGAAGVSAAQQLDTLRALQGATATIRAQAGAAGGGERAREAAGIAAEAAYRSMQGFSGATDEAKEKLTQLALRFDEAGNALIGRGRGAAIRMGAAAANLPVGGVIPAGGVISQAGFTAAETAGLAPGTQLGAANPLTQAQTLMGANQTAQMGTQLLETLQTRIKLMQGAAGGDMSAGGTASLKAQTGILRYEAEVDVQIRAIQEEAAARGGMTKSMQDAVDALTKIKGAAASAADELVKVQQAAQTHRVMVGAQKELAMAQTKYGAIAGGASPAELQAADLLQRFKSALPGEGANASPQDIAALKQYADSIAAVTAATQNAIQAQKEWESTMKGVIDDLGSGLQDLVFGGKGAKDALKSIFMDISKKGFSYFVEDPLKTAGMNLLGIGDKQQPGQGIFGNSGQGFQGWLGKMTGGLLGGTSQETQNAGLLGKIDATAFGGSAGVTPVYVTNPGGMGGGGLADLGGPGGLGPEGGQNPNGSSPSGGGFMSGGLMGSIGNAFSSGWNFLSSTFGGSDVSTAAGAMAADSSIGMGMATGGLVGWDGAPRRVDPAWFAHAPRFAGGGMIGPGEVPIIAHRGEVVLNRGQQAALNKGGNTTHFHMNISAGNLDGFRSSAPQLAMAMGANYEKASRRYG